MSKEIVKADPKAPPPLSADDKKRAEQIAKEIRATETSIKEGYVVIQRGTITIGNILVEVRAKHFWLYFKDDTGEHFKSFGKYVDHVAERLDRSRSQIYQAITVVEKLSPHVTDAQLEDMGITKASELARVIKQTGRVPTQEIIAHAMDPKVSVQDIEQEVYEKYHVKKDYEKGKRRDLGSFYATDEEWNTILSAFAVAAIQGDIGKTVPPGVRLKEILLLMAQYFLGGNEAEAHGN